MYEDSRPFEMENKKQQTRYTIKDIKFCKPDKM